MMFYGRSYKVIFVNIHEISMIFLDWGFIFLFRSKSLGESKIVIFERFQHFNNLNYLIFLTSHHTPFFFSSLLKDNKLYLISQQTDNKPKHSTCNLKTQYLPSTSKYGQNR